MTRVTMQAVGGLAFLLVVIGATVFIVAGTLGYWQAWLFLAVFASSVIAITADLAHRDPALLARRVKAGPIAERELGQKIVQSIASLAFIAIFALAALDHRYGWSRVPVGIVVIGDALVAIGLGIVFLVFRANTFTAAVIEVSRDQQLVSTGPYGVIRHPMYGGALVMLLGTPLALGSWAGLAAVVPLTAAIVWRLVDEERLLAASLPGYIDYRSRVKWRLVPFVW